MEFNKWFMKAVINRELSLIDIAERLSVVKKGEYQIGRTCFCCFHENTDTPAAKIYDDDRGVTLFCFNEQKTYRSSDVFERFSNYKIDMIFNKIWSNLSESDKNYYIMNVAGSEDTLTEDWKITLKELDKFKQRKINYEQFLDILIRKV